MCVMLNSCLVFFLRCKYTALVYFVVKTPHLYIPLVSDIEPVTIIELWLRRLLLNVINERPLPAWVDFADKMKQWNVYISMISQCKYVIWEKRCITYMAKVSQTRGGVSRNYVYFITSCAMLQRDSVCVFLFTCFAKLLRVNLFCRGNVFREGSEYTNVDYKYTPFINKTIQSHIGPLERNKFCFRYLYTLIV